MAEKMKGLTVHIPERLHMKLKIEAAKRATTVRELVTRGIESELKQKRKGGPENEEEERARTAGG